MSYPPLQGALPSNEDCMYYLQLGEAEVVISGGADAKAHGEDRKVGTAFTMEALLCIPTGTTQGLLGWQSVRGVRMTSRGHAWRMLTGVGRAGAC